jgi:hypothetical protein
MGITKSDTAKIMKVLGRIDDEVEGPIETLEILGDESTLKEI